MQSNHKPVNNKMNIYLIFNELKFILLILAFVFLSFPKVQGQSDVLPIPLKYDVYQKGVKIKYGISTKSIFLQFTDAATSATKNTLVQSINQYLDTQNPIREEDTQNNILILNLAPRMGVDRIVILLQQLNGNPFVNTANPFIIQEGEKNLESEIGISHQLYVKLGANMTLANLQQLAAQSGLTLEGAYPYDNQLYILTVNKIARKNALQIANEWTELRRFETVRPNFYIRIKWAGTVNDPLASFQWALKNNGAFTLPIQAPYYALFGTPYPNFTAGADMKVNEAWDIGTGAGVRVALFDDGTQRNHPDLAGNMIAGLGYDPTDNTNLGDLKPASTGHGTATAGVIAAVGNNNIGIAGVAYNSKLIPINLTTGLETLVAQSYDWAWQTANADVICSTWNYTNPLFDSPIINAALQRAFTQGRGGRGCVLFFPSGNAGLNFAQAPANLGQVISVSASTSDDLKANFSSAGRFSDIAAPGANIVTTDITGFAGFNTADYVSYDGSSIAVAQVAGIAALVLGVNPNLTATQVREILQGTADKVGGYTYSPANSNAKSPQTSSWSSEMGYGRANAFNAVRVASRQRLCNALTTLSAPTGYFDDGNALQGYANDTDCSWLIQPQGASQVTLNFLDFKLADSGDKILVYSGSDVNSTLIGNYSNNNSLPISVTSPTGIMLVRFISDGKGTERGWRASYTSNTPSADFTVSNTYTCINNPIRFAVSNPTGNILSYQWDFGAGASPANLTANDATNSVTVNYQNAGLKTITLTLVGATGNVVIQKTNLVYVSATTSGVVNEGFENQFPPNWRILNVNNLGKMWERTQSTLIGGFAESNATMFFNNFEETQNGAEDYLVLPTMSFSGIQNPTLTFDVAYSALATANMATGNDRLRVEYSLDCGNTWIIAYQKSALGIGNASIGGRLGTTISSNILFSPNSCSDWRRENISFPTLAGNNAVLFRFVNISGGGGNGLYLDNIKLTQGAASPTLFSSNTITPSQVSFSWTDNATSELGYVIERSPTEPVFPNPTTFMQIGQVGANVTTFTDTNLSENTTYWYRVSAIQPNGVIDNYSGCSLTVTTSSTTLTTLLSQNFNGCALPMGWVNNDLAFNGDNWTINNSRITTIVDGAFTGYGALDAPANDCFLIFDSDKNSNDFLPENVAIQSPVVNTVGSSTVLLRFDQLFIAGLGGQGFVEVSTNGTIWNTVATYTRTIGTVGIGGNNSIPVKTTIDVSRFLANNANARFRFRWTGNRSFAWAIDNVTLLGTFGAPGNLTANAASETQITLTWRDNTINEGGFSVERSSTSAVGGFAVLATAPSITGAGATVTFNDNTAIAGVNYWYRVRAFVGMTNSNYSNVAQANTTIAPFTFTAAPLSSSTIGLSWTDNSTTEAGFLIERSLSMNGVFAQIAIAPANTTTFLDAGLLENVTYFYRIRTLSGVLTSTNRGFASATTLVAAPTDLISTATNDNEISLQWKDNSRGESGYVVERSLSSTGGFVSIITLPANTISYTDISLQPDTRYFYRVYALDLNANASNRTNTASALTYPARPTNLRASALSSAAISLQWTDNATTETGYIVERGTNLNNFAVVFTLTANQTAFQDTLLQAGQVYFYRVRAIRTLVSSRFSNVTNSVTFRDFAPQPPVLKARAGSRSATLTWEAMSDESRIAYYEIYVLSANVPLSLVGTTGEKRFVATGLENATNYIFRVVAVSISGRSSDFSNAVEVRPSIILGAEDEDNSLIFHVFPNPNQGEFTIQFTNKNTQQFHLSLTNALGQVVLQKDIQESRNFETQLKLNELTSGIYLLSIATKNGTWKKQISIIR